MDGSGLPADLGREHGAFCLPTLRSIRFSRAVRTIRKLVVAPRRCSDCADVPAFCNRGALAVRDGQ